VADPSSAPKLAPSQLGLRFVLEIASLAGIFRGAATFADGALSWAFGAGAVAVAAALWGTFAVKGDPSRSGKAPVPVPGAVRLLIELLVFGAGAAGFALRHEWVALAVFGAALVFHHVMTRARLRWLL
jgi:hypothetical protein